MKKIPVQKNKEYVVNIIDNGFEGEGIAKIDDYTIFVQGAIKGEKIKILILKVKSSYAFGKIVEIIRLHNPIFSKLKITRLSNLIIPPYKVPFIAVLEYPIPFKLLVRGACI